MDMIALVGWSMLLIAFVGALMSEPYQKPKRS